MKQPIIISLGGSLIVPDEIDTVFLRSFIALIQGEVKNGKEFVIITGGGKVCRKYNTAAEELGHPSSVDLDWIGIASTKLNAHFLRVVFGDLAHEEIIDDPTVLGPVSRPIVLGGGFRPGHSSDFGAVEIAHTVGAKKIINLSNIDYAYDKDPRKFPDAKKIEQATWTEFRKILPEEWVPGANVPFDPIAAKRAQELSLEVAIMNGKDLENLRTYLSGQSFKGSVISG